MSSYNKVLLMGNLTRDPEVKHTPKGTAVCKLGLAVNRKWKSEAGEKMEETTFIDVDAFGKQAEVVAQYFAKGNPIFIEGRLKLDQWEGKDGSKQSKLKVVMEGFQFLGGGERKERAEAQPKQQAKYQAPSRPKVESMEDDVPF